MKVVINFKISRILLELAIRSLLLSSSKINKSSILNVIKNTVISKGLSSVHFPEMWGDDLFEHEFDENTIEILIEKYKSLIN